MPSWIRLVVDVTVLIITVLTGYMWLDVRFDRMEMLSNDRWTGADMMLWVAGAEQAHEDASNHKEVKLPNPYLARQMRAAPGEEGG